MAIYIGNKHVTGSTNIYIGSHNTPTIHIGSFKTYPENVTYTLSSVTQHYSAGSTIYASGSNYGYITANVYAWQGGDLIWSASNQTLSVTKVSGTGFSVSGTTQVKADNRGTTEGASRSGVFYGYYGSGAGSAKTSNITFTQEANAITNSNYDPQEYYVEISIGSGVNAAGGSSTVTTYASHKARYLYTSGSYTGLSTRSDTASVTEISDPNNRYSYSNGTLSHENMGKNTTTDSCTLRATNGTATQEASISVTNTYSDTWNNPSVSSFSYGSTIPASGGTSSPSVSASQSGTRTWTSGASDGLTNNAFSYSYAMTASGRWSISSGVVSASTRGTTTGNTETSPTVTVTVSAYSKSGSATATTQQAANSATYKSESIGWTAMTNVNTCSSDGGTYFVLGPYSYNDWYHYTSGADSTKVRHDTVATATSYSNLTSWISVVSSPSYALNVASNGTTSGRTHTISATFSGITKNVEVSQYRAPYSTYEYRFSNYDIGKTSWNNNEYGTSAYTTVTAETQYRTVTWKDGQTTTGAWTTYTSGVSAVNKPYAVIPQGHFKFYGYDGSTGAQMIDFYYPNQYYTYGTARVYPNTQNAQVADVVNTMQLRFGDAQQDVTLTHKGDGSFNISPTSLSFASAASSATITVTTYLTGWSVSDNAGWVSTSVNGNNVTVTVTENTSTTQSRSAIVSFSQGGRTVATCPVSQTTKPVPPTPTGTTVEGIYKLFELGDGWIVGYYISSKNTSPCNWNANTLVIARNDAGSNTTFSLTGHYDTHMCGTNTDVNWSTSSRTYTAGTKLTGTALPGETQWDCYGFSIGGGPGANTQSAYAGISII